MKRKWAVRVVLAHPGDVADECEAVERAVAHTNLLLKASNAPAFLELWSYEKDTRPGLHEGGPQILVESFLKIEESDLVIAIFWRRLGTPVGGAPSGTASEIQRAIEARKSSKGSPELMVYFKKPAPLPSDEHEQFAALQAFKRHLLTTVKPLVRDYDLTPDRFELLVGEHLWSFVQGLLPNCSDIDLRPLTLNAP